ncbi:hypothetical protein HJFPF1_06092 [Paramyrothecium foliicola]|nr:hypothetical protein HJFPF1_06092 [Paramyrothecium foliicola]
MPIRKSRKRATRQRTVHLVHEIPGANEENQLITDCSTFSEVSLGQSDARSADEQSSNAITYATQPIPSQGWYYNPRQVKILSLWCFFLLILTSPLWRGYEPDVEFFRPHEAVISITRRLMLLPRSLCFSDSLNDPLVKTVDPSPPNLPMPRQTLSHITLELSRDVVRDIQFLMQLYQDDLTRNFSREFGFEYAHWQLANQSLEEPLRLQSRISEQHLTIAAMWSRLIDEAQWEWIGSSSNILTVADFFSHLKKNYPPYEEDFFMINYTRLREGGYVKNGRFHPHKPVPSEMGHVPLMMLQTYRRWSNGLGSVHDAWGYLNKCKTADLGLGASNHLTISPTCWLMQDLAHSRTLTERVAWLQERFIEWSDAALAAGISMDSEDLLFGEPALATLARQSINLIHTSSRLIEIARALSTANLPDEVASDRGGRSWWEHFLDLVIELPPSPRHEAQRGLSESADRLSRMIDNYLAPNTDIVFGSLVEYCMIIRDLDKFKAVVEEGWVKKGAYSMTGQQWVIIKVPLLIEQWRGLRSFNWWAQQIGKPLMTSMFYEWRVHEARSNS